MSSVQAFIVPCDKVVGPNQFLLFTTTCTGAHPKHYLTQVLEFVASNVRIFRYYGDALLSQHEFRVITSQGKPLIISKQSFLFIYLSICLMPFTIFLVCFKTLTSPLN